MQDGQAAAETDAEKLAKSIAVRKEIWSTLVRLIERATEVSDMSLAAALQNALAQDMHRLPLESMTSGSAKGLVQPSSEAFPVKICQMLNAALQAYPDEIQALFIASVDVPAESAICKGWDLDEDSDGRPILNVMSLLRTVLAVSRDLYYLDTREIVAVYEADGETVERFALESPQ